MQMPAKSMGRTTVHAAMLCLSAWLSACGGGGATTPEATGVTPLPELSIATPAVGDVAQAVAFKTSAVLAPGLKASWDFGDGSSSTDATPQHSYAKAGEYEVRLTLTNEAGQTRQYKQTLLLNRPAVTKGLQCAKADETGWCWQVPQPTGNATAWVTMVDDKAGWRVGEGGEVYRTLDAGKTWTRRRTPTDVALLAVVPLSANEAWVIGSANTLLHTVDGGGTWQASAMPADINGSVYGNVHGYADGFLTLAGGALAMRDTVTGTLSYRYSTDAGQSWQLRTVANAYNALSHDGKGRVWVIKTDGQNAMLIQMDLKTGIQSTALNLKPLNDESSSAVYGEDSVYSVGDTVIVTQNGLYYDSSKSKSKWVSRTVVQSSLDAGKSWKVQSPSLSSLPIDYSGQLRVVAADATATRLAGQINDTQLFSLDGGASWQVSSRGVDVYDGVADNCVTVSGDRLLCLESYLESLAMSSDMGASWSRVHVSNGFNSNREKLRLRGLPNGNAQVSTMNGESYVYLAGADQWVQVSVASKAQMRSVVSFADGSNGLMLTADNHLFATANGGVSWKEQPVSLGQLSSKFDIALARLGGNKVGLVSSNGTVMLSNDGGKSWSFQSEQPGGSPAGLERFVFQDDKFHWILPGNDYPGAVRTKTIRISTDGSQTWRSILSPLFYVNYVYRHAAGRLTIVGERGLVAQSDDEGVTWFYRLTGVSTELKALHSLDGQRMWVVGARGTVLLSTDGGVSWTKVNQSTDLRLRDVRFADADHGWIVGDSGLILATRDGGKTWERQASVTAQNLFRIEVVDSRTAWVMGENGAVLATGTAGF